MEAAGRHTAELVDLAAGVRPAGIEVPFDVLPTAALQDLVGFAADGSPLREVYGEIAGGVADRVTDTMVSAVAAGLGPRETARLIRREFGRLTAREQEQVLGKAAFAAYRAGAVGLADFAGRRRSDDWETTLTRRSLQDILGVEPARRWIRAARLTTTRQRLQAAVERRLHDVDVEFVLREVVAARSLPRVGYHFERHAPDLDVNSEEEYLERLAVHLQRGDLVFYALLREQGDLMLYAIAVDTGEVALYNVDRKSLWSFYASADITQFIEQAPIVQLRRPEG
ncbi:MAG: hypothetical protein IT324_22925 [Anaerolineae bacterium]|nr:hypothetical protein [Anaerolineae bacterium]